MADELFAQAYPLARRAAGVRLASAIAQGSVTPSERPDLEQELLTAVWRALPKYDSSRASLRTFVEMVVASRFISLVRARRCRPAFEPIENVQPVGLDGIPAVEFREDFHRVSEALADRDRRLASCLMQNTPTEASRTLRVSRSTVYEGIRRIRTIFANAGFGPTRRRRP